MNFLFQAKDSWRRPQVSFVNAPAVTCTTNLVLGTGNNLVCSPETRHCCPFLLSGVVCGLGYRISFLIRDFGKSLGAGQVTGAVVPFWPELLQSFPWLCWCNSPVVLPLVLPVSHAGHCAAHAEQVCFVVSVVFVTECIDRVLKCQPTCRAIPVKICWRGEKRGFVVFLF